MNRKWIQIELSGSTQLRSYTPARYRTVLAVWTIRCIIMQLIVMVVHSRISKIEFNVPMSFDRHFLTMQIHVLRYLNKNLFRSLHPLVSFRLRSPCFRRIPFLCVSSSSLFEESWVLYQHSSLYCRRFIDRQFWRVFQFQMLRKTNVSLYIQRDLRFITLYF